MIDMSLAELSGAYRSHRMTPLQVVESICDRIDSDPDRGVWISRVPRERLRQHARSLAAEDPSRLPLYGVPFAIKDNIDLAGLPTTAACPAFAYQPSRSAAVVERLMAAGAIPIGKTNLDQFATGLVGTRSPYGICRNSVDPAYISGGSSSGSAVAVALGLASFALGTDTAGSGRVPAAFNGIIGLKPSCGMLSARGVVPACRTLDVVSIFAATAADAAQVCRVAEGFDAEDAYSRRPGPRRMPVAPGAHFRFGVPEPSQLQFFGNAACARLFERALARVEAAGGVPVAIDFAPFLEAGRLLYGGPWVAERFTVIEALLSRHPDAIHPVTRRIIENARGVSAADTFRAQYRLKELQRAVEPVWNDVEVIVTPTAGTIYRIDEIDADPIHLNANLGYYTSFANLLDLAAVALPGGADTTGLPFGISLTGPAWSDYALLALAARLHGESIAGDSAESSATVNAVTLVVCGAHMDGLPLNHQLRTLGAKLLARTSTAPQYRLFALPGGPPHRPGLVRVQEHGAAIEVELWTVPAAAFGGFVGAIPAPLAIGKVLLADGTQSSGFLCESAALTGARDITGFAGWRAYLAASGGL